MDNCPLCNHLYMYEIVKERVSLSGLYKTLCLKCMFCGRVEYKKEKLKKRIDFMQWNKITSQ